MHFVIMQPQNIDFSLLHYTTHLFIPHKTQIRYQYSKRLDNQIESNSGRCTKQP